MKIVQLPPSPLGFPFNLNFYQFPNFKNGYQNHYVPLKMGWVGWGIDTLRKSMQYQNQICPLAVNTKVCLPNNSSEKD